MATIEERDDFVLYTLGPFTSNEDGVGDFFDFPQTHMVGYLSVTSVNLLHGDEPASPTLDVVIDAEDPTGGEGHVEQDAFTQATGVTNQRLVATLDPLLDSRIRVRWTVGRADTRARPEFVWTLYLAAKSTQ